MFTFHGNATATVADEFHSSQLAFAHVGLVDFRRSAERAVLVIATGVAQVTRIFGQCATSFTGIGHFQPPLLGDFDMLTSHTAGADPQHGNTKNR